MLTTQRLYSGAATLLVCSSAAIAQTTDFVRSPSPSGNFPLHDPSSISANYEHRSGFSDVVDGQRISVNILSGFDGGNYSGQVIGMNIRGRIQGGGARDLTINHWGLDDTVRDTAVIGCSGIVAGYQEGCEYRRHFLAFLNARFGGAMSKLGVDPFGRERMRLSFTQNYDRGAAAEGRLLIDLSQKFSPPGNVTDLGAWSDNRFGTMTPDPALSAALAARFGRTSYQTVVVAGADTAKYDGKCPSTSLGPWGADRDGNAIDPYSSQWDGSGAKTNAQCITVRSTANMTAGQLIGIWGSRIEYETTTITQVVDPTHIIAPLAYSHPAGELVTWGAGVGWAVSSPRNDYAPGTLSTVQNTQSMPQHAAYPIIGIFNGQIVLYGNADAVGFGELHLNMFQSNYPRAPITFAPTVVAGVVTALNQSGGDYSTANTSLPGPQTVLPPPAISITGCAVKPVVEAVAGPFYWYNYRLVSGGSGCVHPVIKAQKIYSQPVVFYPAVKTYKILDAHPCTDESDHFDHCPYNGFLLTHPILQDAWLNGDTVEIAPHWHQYMSDQVTYSNSPDVYNSGRTGPMSSVLYANVQRGQPAFNWSNTTPGTAYFGDASTHFMRSAEPGKALYATEQAPIHARIGGTHSIIWEINPPMFGAGLQGAGTVIDVNCNSAGQDGPGSDLPCKRKVYPDYTLLHDGVGPNSVSLGVSNTRGCITTNGVCISGYLSGVTPVIRGGPLAAGGCVSGTATVNGAVVGQPVVVSPTGGLAPPLIIVSAGVTRPNTVEVRECAVVAINLETTAFNVRVLP